MAQEEKSLCSVDLSSVPRTCAKQCHSAPQSCRPASLAYTVTDHRDPVSGRVLGKDQHPRMSSDYHMHAMVLTHAHPHIQIHTNISHTQAHIYIYKYK